jgi:glycerol kinase
MTATDVSAPPGSEAAPAGLVLAIDQGTTSTRAMLFDHAGRAQGIAQKEHAQHFPQPGWVEHDPVEIWRNTREVVASVLAGADVTHEDITAAGITNQRETVVVWDRRTGEPIHPAIVWQDTRTQNICDRLAAAGGGTDRFADTVGLPLATYFAGPKVMWLLENIEGARDAAEAGHLLMGTLDSWVLWNATGGIEGGVHATDVTNASRTMLMDLRTLSWDEDICAEMGIPLSMLPEIRPSSGDFGRGRSHGLLPGVCFAGVLGDQQAATFGQACFTPGEAKNTYGTGNFLLLNTGTDPVRSANGLITTVAYQIGEQPAVYALEGSVAVTGSLVQWLRDNIGLISSAAEIETLAGEVSDNGGVYIVPAFSGLFAPYWRPDARGVIVGLTRYANRHHVARAALEAVAFQSVEVARAMGADSGVALAELRVDGGMVVNDLLMQVQADLLGVPVVRPEVAETTALGAAYAAGLAVGFWSSTEEIAANWREGRRWEPRTTQTERDAELARWRQAVQRTLGWVQPGNGQDTASADGGHDEESEATTHAG